MCVSSCIHGNILLTQTLFPVRDLRGHTLSVTDNLQCLPGGKVIHSSKDFTLTMWLVLANVSKHSYVMATQDVHIICLYQLLLFHLPTEYSCTIQILLLFLCSEIKRHVSHTQNRAALQPETALALKARNCPEQSCSQPTATYQHSFQATVIGGFFSIIVKFQVSLVDQVERICL